METVSDIQKLVDEQVTAVADPRVREEMTRLLVTPYEVERAWDYGRVGEMYPCWTVLEHQPSNTGIAYCSGGFGPKSPWGLVFLSGPYTGIGMDAAWYVSLEGAFRESKAWGGENPPGYESE